MIKKNKTNKKSIKKSLKKSNKTRKNKLNKVNKQNGSSLFNIATDMISNTKPLKQNYQDIITIIYNRNTPKTIMLNSTSPNTLYQSSLVESVPHIQMKDYENHYLLVIILPGIKPQLLWAIEIKNGAKIKSILDYYIPRYQDGFRFKILFKLHKYQNNIKETETFKVDNNMSKERHVLFNELKNYLTKNNMLIALFLKEVDIIQDKGQNISQFLNMLAK